MFSVQRTLGSQSTFLRCTLRLQTCVSRKGPVASWLSSLRHGAADRAESNQANFQFSARVRLLLGRRFSARDGSWIAPRTSPYCKLGSLGQRRTGCQTQIDEISGAGDRSNLGGAGDAPGAVMRSGSGGGGT